MNTNKKIFIMHLCKPVEGLVLILPCEKKDHLGLDENASQSTLKYPRHTIRKARGGDTDPGMRKQTAKKNF